MSKIRIASLGGIGENGKNMYVVEVDDKIFVLDAGLIYPEIDMYGIDAVVPNVDYLIEIKNRIKGIFLSHGHIDHIGAVAYLLKYIKAPIYGTDFTISLVEATILSHGLNVEDYHLYRINKNKKLKFDNVNVTFINVNHSLPDSAIIVISTPDGNIVYAPDFNFSIELTQKYAVAYDKLLDLTSKNNLVVMAESVGISDNNRPDNDAMFDQTIYKEIVKVDGTIYVVSFSTDVSRIQKIINTAIVHNRKIGFIGGRGEQIVSMAIKTGHLVLKPEDYITADTPRNKKLYFVVGNYAEPYYMINKILKGGVKNQQMVPGDEIITLSSPLAGTTVYALSVIDEIYRNNILHLNVDKTQFRTSHATKTDLNQLYKITNPKYILPIKGEDRHIDRHIRLLDELKLSDKYLDLRDGKIIEFIDGVYNNSNDKIKIGKVYVDGSLTGTVNDKIVKERDTLAQHGIIIITTYVDTKAKEIVKEPNIITKGFAYNKFDDTKLELLKEAVTKVIKNNLEKKNKTLAEIETHVTNEAKKVIMRLIKEEVSLLTPIINVKKDEKKENKLNNSKTLAKK